MRSPQKNNAQDFARQQQRDETRRTNTASATSHKRSSLSHATRMEIASRATFRILIRIHSIPPGLPRARTCSRMSKSPLPKPRSRRRRSHLADHGHQSRLWTNQATRRQGPTRLSRRMSTKHLRRERDGCVSRKSLLAEERQKTHHQLAGVVLLLDLSSSARVRTLGCRASSSMIRVRLLRRHSGRTPPHLRKFPTREIGRGSGLRRMKQRRRPPHSLPNEPKRHQRHQALRKQPSREVSAAKLCPRRRRPTAAPEELWHSRNPRWLRGRRSVCVAYFRAGHDDICEYSMSERGLSKKQQKSAHHVGENTLSINAGMW